MDALYHFVPSIFKEFSWDIISPRGLSEIFIMVQIWTAMFWVVTPHTVHVTVLTFRVQYKARIP
jgi:hypothetical protein